MSTVQPTRAPLLLEKLSSEELLKHYCQTKEEAAFLIVWERLADKNDPQSFYTWLRRISRYICPVGYPPDWIFYGSFKRAYYRLQRYCCRKRPQLNTKEFERYKYRIAKCSVIDEYRWVRSEEQGEPLGDFDIFDDTGEFIRPTRKEDLELWERIDRARHEDEERLLAEEEREVSDDGNE